LEEEKLQLIEELKEQLKEEMKDDEWKR
jgi:hypothetical protein